MTPVLYKRFLSRAYLMLRTTKRFLNGTRSPPNRHHAAAAKLPPEIPATISISRARFDCLPELPAAGYGAFCNVSSVFHPTAAALEPPPENATISQVVSSCSTLSGHIPIAAGS